MRVIHEYPLCGKHCYIKPYKKGKLLKVFNIKSITDKSEIESTLWGDKVYEDLMTYIPIWQACIVQNILYYHDIAPRVYELILLRNAGQRYLTQIVEDVGTKFCDTHKDAEPVYYKAKEIGQKYYFTIGKPDVSLYDVIEHPVKGKLLVDFNTFYFFKKDWKQRIEDEYSKDRELMDLIRPFYIENLV